MNNQLSGQLLVVFSLVCASYAYAADAIPEAVVRNDAGCNLGPLAQFGQYLGDWDIEDSTRNRTTGAWEPGPGARWVFVCVGDGIAIQDFWMPNDGGFGTNLRSYRSDSERWDIVWARQGGSGLSRISAQQQGDVIVMHYREPLPTPNRRITFFPVAADGWHWRLEFEGADGQWQEVYRIHAIPRADDAD